jgi:hypothetical protein
MKTLYLAKEPDAGVRNDLSRISGEITIVDCLNAYGDYYRKKGYNCISRMEFFALENMKFDVVIGNPPYQRAREVRNIGAPLWPDFIEHGLENLEDGGILTLVIPATWLKRLSGKSWKLISSNNLISCDPDVKWAFPNVGGNGGTFSVITLKKGKYQGKTSIRGEFDVDIINDVLPTNNTQFTKDNIEFLKSKSDSIMDLNVVLGPVKPSITSEHYSDVETDTHKHNVYYSGAADRRSIWCDQPIGDCGKLKLVVPNSGNFYKNMEITTKGAGRQTSYVLGTQKELELIRDRMLSTDSKRVSDLMAEGNYNYPLKWVVQ